MYVTGHFCRLVYFFFQCTNPVQHKDKSRMTFPHFAFQSSILSSLSGFKDYARGCYPLDKHVTYCIQVIQLQAAGEEAVLPS